MRGHEKGRKNMHPGCQMNSVSLVAHGGDRMEPAGATGKVIFFVTCAAVRI